MNEKNVSSASAKQVAKGIFWNFSAYFITMVIGIFVSAIMVRTLGKALYGTYILVATILGYATIFSQFNFTTALLRYVPEYKKFQDASGLKKFICKLAFIQFAIWLFFLLLIFFVGDLISDFYKIDLKIYLIVGLVSAIVTISANLIQAVLTTFYEIRIQAVLAVLSGVLHVLILYFFIVVCRFDIIGCFLALLCKDLCLLVGYSWKLYKILLKLQTIKKVKIKNRRLFHFVTPSVLNNFVNHLVTGQSETLYLGYFSSSADVSVYSVGSAFPKRFVSVIPNILRNVMNTAFTDYYLKDEAYLKKLTEVYYKVLFMFIAPFSIGGALLVDKAVVMIYGADMETAGRIAQVLFVVHTFILFSNPYTFVMRTLENMWIGFRISIISAIVSITLNLVMISQYGLMGAVVAITLTLSINGLLRFLIYRRHYPFIDVPWSNICRCYLSTLCFLPVVPFRHLISNPLHLIIAFICMVACWIVTAKLLKLIDDDTAKVLIKMPILGEKIVQFFRV